MRYLHSVYIYVATGGCFTISRYLQVYFTIINLQAMKWININKELLGEPLYVTPDYDHGSESSIINYISGFSELDSTLAEKGNTFSSMNVELKMLVYENIVLFILVKGSEEMEYFTIDREKVVKINIRHSQTLNIRKDPGIEAGTFVSKTFRLFGNVIAKIAKLIDVNMKNKPVVGSIFEIVLDSTINSQNEKIVIACTDKNKETIEMICSKIIK